MVYFQYMEGNPKTIAVVSLLGVAAVLVFFWSQFSDSLIGSSTTPVEQGGAQVITSIEDLPPGIPPPPAAPDFDKNQFHIPGVTDGIATPTPQQ